MNCRHGDDVLLVCTRRSAASSTLCGGSSPRRVDLSVCGRTPTARPCTFQALSICVAVLWMPSGLAGPHRLARTGHCGVRRVFFILRLRLAKWGSALPPRQLPRHQPTRLTGGLARVGCPASASRINCRSHSRGLLASTRPRPAYRWRCRCVPIQFAKASLSLALESTHLALKTGAISPFFISWTRQTAPSHLSSFTTNTGDAKCCATTYRMCALNGPITAQSHGCERLVVLAGKKWMCVLERLTCFHRCMNARAHDHNPARQRSTFIDETVQTAQGNDQRLCGW